MKVFAIILSILLVLPFPGTAILYNQSFGSRIDSIDSPLNLSIADYIDLTRKPIEFASNKGQTLRGFVYKNRSSNEEPLGLIIFSHGLGGGHEEYMEVVNYFVQRDFWVLGFDNTGTYRSDGQSIGGLPQATIDLAAAIDYVENNEDLCRMPRFICGHSMGGYASCAVLNYDVAVDGVVSLAGFNRTKDIILEVGKKQFGNWVKLISPYIDLYEMSKFGQTAKLKASEGINRSRAKVLLVHGDSDDMISLESSIYRYFAEGTHTPVQVQLIPGGTHDLIFLPKAFDYRWAKNEDLLELGKQYGGQENVPEAEMETFMKSVNRGKLRPQLNTDLFDDVVVFLKSVIKDLSR